MRPGRIAKDRPGKGGAMEARFSTGPPISYFRLGAG